MKFTAHVKLMCVNWMLVCSMVSDELMERVGEILEDDEDEKITWGGQFVQ